MKAPKGLLVLAASLWFPFLTLQSATLYVNIENTNCDDFGPGTIAEPFCFIQFAYDAADKDDTILVRPGTYGECVIAAQPIGLPPKPLSIIAEDSLPPPSGTNNNTSTIISAKGICDSVVPTSGGSTIILGHDVTLQGFTVRDAGRSGIFSLGSVVISNNVITSNASDFGGGILAYADTCSYGDIDAVISDNTISDNRAVFVGTVALSGEGGGIDVLADTRVPGGGCVGGDATVTIEDNVISTNRAEVQGGGIGIYTQSELGTSSHVIVTQNMISGNTIDPSTGGIRYGGGIWIGTHLDGSETIEIEGNTLDGNHSSGDGGGISAVISAVGTHTVRIDKNTIEDNTADGNGGGMDLFIAAADLGPSQSATMTASHNIVRRNAASALDLPLGGGGILATLFASRTTAGLNFDIVGNSVTDNDAQGAGGGATLYVNADADVGDFGELAAPSSAQLDFSNNLVAGNEATDAGLSSVGGGLFVLLEAFGDADASVDVGFSTLADNYSDIGGGGIEVESFTGCDANHPTCNPVVDAQFDGRADLGVNRSIIADNIGYGIGGPLPGTSGVISLGGTGNLRVAVASSDFFNNLDGNFEPTLTTPIPTVPPRPAALSQSNTRLDDPQLDPDGPDNVEDDTPGDFDDYSHSLCSHIGWASPLSLPDVNGDEFVGGIDILRIAVAFSASAQATRYNPAADINGDGIVDGTDLAVVISALGEDCF